MITIFAIVMLFSSVAPLVTFAGTIFFLIRHCIDAFNLLTFYLKETESSGRIATQLINWTIGLIFLYEICMMCFFAYNKLKA